MTDDATTPLISRAQTDPLGTATIQQRYGNDNEQKADSMFVAGAIKKYASYDASYDYKGKNIQEFSVEVVAIKRLRTEFGRQRTQQIVVPARDDLVKVPLWSTPLTVESTNHAFYDFKERLTDMGLAEEAEAALIHTQCESVETAIAFIYQHSDAIYHRFGAPYPVVINEEKEEEVDINKLCAQCQKPYNRHLINQNGLKIPFNLNQNKWSNLHLDEKQEEVRVISVSLGKEAVHDLLQKTESLFPPTATHSGVTEQCLICFDEKPLDHFMVSECGHNQYCNACLTEHYRVKTQDGDVLKVKCIDPRCGREVTEEEILKFITDEALKEKFHKFKRDKLLMLDENARFCPTVDCDGYMIGSRISPKLVCPECSTTICFNCSRLWHGYFTKCTSAQVAAPVDENDEKFHQWELNKRDNVKKCPKCKMRIEKDAGCNHMTCVSCKYEFCWLCKGKYTSRHYSAWNIFGCPGAQFGQPRSKMKMCCRSLVIILLMILLSPIILVLCILYALITILAHCLVCWLDICCCRW
eukprot:99427_1